MEPSARGFCVFERPFRATSGDPFGPLTAIGVGTTLGGGYLFNRFKDKPSPPASVKEE